MPPGAGGMFHVKPDPLDSAVRQGPFVGARLARCGLKGRLQRRVPTGCCAACTDAETARQVSGRVHGPATVSRETVTTWMGAIKPRLTLSPAR